MRAWWLVAWWLVFGVSGVSAERLIVFVDSDGSVLQAAFADEQLPELRELAETMELELEVFDVAERGVVPEGVGITPLIAFQNWRGTSIYQGRYTTLDRVRNFVRTSRFVPQGDAAFVRENVPVWDRGAMAIAVPLKVTDWSGPGAVALGDEAGVTAAIASGMSQFNLTERVELGRSDRQWYADFHPYIDEAGTLFVNTELYSQFNCHVPVTSWLDDPVSGPANRWQAIFAAAAARTEVEIVRQLTESELGDGFDVVNEPSVVWAQAGLALPDKPEGANVDLADVELPGAWVVDADAQADFPAVQFTWPPPVDAYSGEAQAIGGTVQLGGDAENGWTFAGLSGSFKAEAKSVTMGEPDLDAYIHSGILEAGEHPEPVFTIERVDVESGFASQPVALGELVPVTLHGTFTMLGQSIPLTVPMSVEAFVGEDGRARLSLTGQWDLPLSAPWDIDGPPGPKEASSVMKFACRIVLEPAEP